MFDALLFFYHLCTFIETYMNDKDKPCSQTFIFDDELFDIINNI